MQQPTVVLFHSSASSARQWNALVQALQPRFRVHAVDLYGHGRQAPWAGPRGLTLADEAALALPVIEAAGGAHLVGHSYGGAVALHLALTRPALVHSVSVYEPVLLRMLCDHDRHSAATRELVDVAGFVRKQVRDEGDALVAAQRFVDYWSGDGAWGRLDEKAQDSVAGRMPLVAQHFDALLDDPVLPARLARLAMPLLALTGERSTAAARRVGALLKLMLPQARHETIDGLGHMGPVTHAAQVNARVVDFVFAKNRAAVEPDASFCEA